MASVWRVQRRFVAIALWLCVTSSAALAACSSAHDPSSSTETGNPPVIDLLRVALKVSADGVSITGDKGAVAPGGAAIEITNLATSEVTHAVANDDGSFSVEVNGSANDAFVVRATLGAAASKPVYVVRGGAMVSSEADGGLSCGQRAELAARQLAQAAASADTHCEADADCMAVRGDAICIQPCDFAVVSQAGAVEIEAAGETIDKGLCSNYTSDLCAHPTPVCPDAAPPVTCKSGTCVQLGSTGGPLSCQDLDSTASQQLMAAEEAADRSCTSDADCVQVSPSLSCHDTCGYAQPASQAGKSAIESVVAAIEANVCAEFAKACSFVALPCVPDAPRTSACSGGECIGLPSCTSCLTQDISWGYTGGNSAYEDRSTLEPCVHYIRTRTLTGETTAMMTCSAQLLACNAAESSGAVGAALANADVQAGLAQSPMLYGYDRRPVDAPIFEIKVDTATLWVGEPCDGQPGCVAIPTGVSMLVDLLKQIDEAEAQPDNCPRYIP